VYGQDHLEPSDGVFGELEIMSNYYDQVKEILFKDLSYRPMAQLVIIPSFSKEVVWQIYQPQDSDKYYSIFRTGTANIWYNQYEVKPKKIEAITKEVEISKETAELINDLFTAAVYTVKYASEDGTIGLDGTTYYFSVFYYGMKSGTTWSPSKDSKMGQLVEICQELINSTEKEEKPNANLLESIKQLTLDLN
jgi:hypothetical protein